MSEINKKLSNLVDLLHWRAMNQPDAQAYLFLADGESEEISITYHQLAQKVQLIGTALQSHSTPGERVLLLYPPGLDYIAAFFGCLYAGVVAVPCPPPSFKRSLDRIKSIVTNAQTTGVLTTSDLQENIATQFKEHAILDDYFLLNTDTITEPEEKPWRPSVIEEGTLAFLQYTSGSTSSPKGVMLTHGNLVHNLKTIQHGFGQTEDSHAVIWLPPYHDMGLIGGILQPLYAGFRVTLMSPLHFLQKPFRWLQAISRYKATTSGGPNFAYDLCVRRVTPEQRATLDLSSWEVAFNGSEPINPDTLDRFVGTFGACQFRREAFYPCYGLAEATLFVSGGHKADLPIIRSFQASEISQKKVRIKTQSDQHSRLLVGCGHTSPDQTILIVNPETHIQCEEDIVGEIWLSGPSITEGYWHQKEETARCFHAHLKDTGAGPYFRTGDLGFIHDDELFITGRLKDLIIIRGLNHHPQDIERTVAKCHPALRSGHAAAFSIEEGGEERLVIVQEVERTYLRKLDMDSLTQTIRGAVSEEHEIQVYSVLLLKPGHIPMTSSGKVQRRVCRLKFLEQDFAPINKWVQILEDNMDISEEARPQIFHQLEEASKEERPALLSDYLQNELSKALKLTSSQVDVEQPLNTMGIDSLLAMEFKHRLETDLGVIWPMARFLQDLTIIQISRQLIEEMAIESTSSSMSVTQDNASQLLVKLDRLSDNQVDDLLNDLLDQGNTSNARIK